MVGLTYLVAARLCSRRIALVAAALTAVNPYLIFMSSYVLSENLYTVLLLVFLIEWEGGRREGYTNHLRLALMGALLGLAALARPNAAMLAAVAAAALLVLASGGLARRLGAAAVLVAGLGLVLAPWAVRNHQRMGQWIILTTHGGITFYQANNPLVCANPALRGGVAPREALPGWERISAAADPASNREAWRLGRAFLRENPGKIPGLLLGKFERFWRLRSHVPLSGVKSGWWWNKGSTLGRLASDLDVGAGLRRAGHTGLPARTGGDRSRLAQDAGPLRDDSGSSRRRPDLLWLAPGEVARRAGAGDLRRLRDCLAGRKVAAAHLPPSLTAAAGCC